MSCHPYLKINHVSSLSDEQNQKGHSISTKSESRFYENLACALFIGSELDVREKSLISCKKENCSRLSAWPKQTALKMSKNVKNG